MRSDRALNNPLIWAIGGALISTWFFGVFHAYRDHGTTRAIAALLLPPYGLYMAAERSIAHSMDGGRVFRMPVAELIEEKAAECRESDSMRQESALSVEQFAEFCGCVWQYVVDNFPPDENEYVDKYGENSPELANLKSRAIRACYDNTQNSGVTGGT